MFSKRLAELKPYVPGEQPGDREYIKLNANENAFPPCPAVCAAVASVKPETLSRYPDPEVVKLREAIADSLNRTGGVLTGKQSSSAFTVTPQMIFAGNGSDEVLSFVFYALFENNLPIIIPEFTYSFYPVYAGYYGLPLKKVPLKKDFSVDIDALLSIPSSGIIFANPNAPTGIALPISAIRSLLERYPRDKAVVVDEAYADFAGESVLPLLAEYKNLVIIRTFSKSMCFAGMRLGYAIAQSEVIEALTTVKNSFNHFSVDGVCQLAGIAACANTSWYAANCAAVIKNRDNFSAELCSLGWTVFPSSANFVLAGKPGTHGSDIYKKLKEQGILVRHFDIPGIRDFVRITIGTGEQMTKLLTAIKIPADR